MTTAPTNVNEEDAIAKAVQHYIDGAKSGKGDDMKPAFHKDATIFGYAGADLFGGPIQQLFDWSDGNGPATALTARIAKIDLVETVATVRLELDNWFGFRYTDRIGLGQRTVSGTAAGSAAGLSSLSAAHRPAATRPDRPRCPQGTLPLPP